MILAEIARWRTAPGTVLTLGPTPASLAAAALVDPGRIFLFGHSMGGVMAPLLAAEEPVRGVAVYGTVFRTWFEYLVENVRRQSRLSGADFAAVEKAVRDETRFLAGLCLEGKAPAEILREHGGRLSACNRPEGGACFVLWLPLTDDSPDLPS